MADAATFVCMHVWFFMHVKSHTYNTRAHAWHSGGWREESSLHMRVLHVQLSLNHRSPPPPPFPTFSLSLFFLYPCCPSVPTVFLPPLCPPFLLSFISPPSHVHSWPTVRVLLLLSCCILVIPSSQLCLFGMNLRWHWFNLLKCKGSWEPAGPK